MTIRENSRYQLPPNKKVSDGMLQGVRSFTLIHMRAILWSVYTANGIVICVALGILNKWGWVICASWLFILAGMCILMLNMRKIAKENTAIRDENTQLLFERDKLIKEAGEYPCQIEQLENQRRKLDNQLENEKLASEKLRIQIKENKSIIGSLESEQEELNRKVGLPRRDIDLTSQEVAAGEIHLFIKVPPPPKVELKYLERESFRTVKSRDISAESAEDLTRWLKEGKIQWAFSNSSGDIRRIGERDMPSDNEIFFIGDIHGDFKSLQRIVEHVDQVDPHAVLVFLGDLFDRGAQEMEAVCLFLTLIKSRPGKILWIVGNHDAALKYENNGFVSTVSPASFYEKLNAHPEWKEFGLELIRLIATLPVAAIFPDGLWVSHGAVPHSDVQAEIEDLAALPKLAKTDCVNARLVDQMKKIPNRCSSTHDVGYDNVISFINIIKEKTGVEIRQLLCAHQHAVTDGAGIMQYRKYFKSVLCHGIYSSNASPGGEEKVAPCIAENRPDRAPLIVAFE